MDTDKLGTLELGNFLKKKRLEKHISQSELADLLHVSRAAVSKWETGINFPGLQNLKELSKILDFPLSRLWDQQEDPQEPTDAASQSVPAPSVTPTAPPDSVPALPAKQNTAVKTALAAIAAAFLLITLIASVILYFRNDPVFTVLENYHGSYKGMECCCFIVICQGSFSKDAWIDYTNTFREKYLDCFNQVEAIVIAYFDDYDRTSDSLDTADFLTVLYPSPYPSLESAAADHNCQ